jgi:hypothetical protein
VANTGATCNDNTACTSGEKCQTGSCGGGSPMNCDTNPCKTGQSCTAGACGGGSNVSQNTPCETNKFCDGAGACKCKVKSSWNLLTNPGFDGNADDWVLNGTASYNNGNDVNACQGSGSVNVNSLSATFRQCISATAGQNYWFGYRFKGSGSSGTATCSVAFLGGSCNANSLDGIALYGSISGATWIQIADTMKAPTGTTHLEFNCSAAAATGYYDQLFVSKSSQGAGAF